MGPHTLARRKASRLSEDKDLAELRKRVAAFCAESGHALSPQADVILRDIMNMKRLTGDFYCPCQPQRTPETVCVCQPVRNGLVEAMGSCFCSLILDRNSGKEPAS